MKHIMMHYDFGLIQQNVKYLGKQKQKKRDGVESVLN